MMTVISDNATWAQVTVPTGRQEIRAVAASLRRCGWTVKSIPQGRQVTDTGVWRLTMIDVRGANVDEQIVRNVFCRHGLIVR